MFKNSELSNEIASSLHGKLTIVKNADAHVKKSIFKEALSHLSDAAELLDRSGDDVTASFITDVLEKLADGASPFAEHDANPDTVVSGEIDELQNQINVLSDKDALHVRGILENNGYDVTSDFSEDEVKGHRLGTNDAPEINIIVTQDTEPGMGGHWTVRADTEADTTIMEEDLEKQEQMMQVAQRLADITKNADDDDDVLVEIDRDLARIFDV